MFLLNFSLFSKTVPRYLYSVTLSTFTPPVKRSKVTVGAFLKFPLFCKHSNQVHRIVIMLKFGKRNADVNGLCTGVR